MATLYFEDLAAGYRSVIGTYRLGREEMVELARRWEPQPQHIDEEAAKESGFDGLTAASLHLFAICTRLFFDSDDRIAVIAMLGKDEVRLPTPARPGDLLTYRTECVSSRPSRSRPERGIVTLRDTLSRENGDNVLTQKVSLLVARRPE